MTVLEEEFAELTAEAEVLVQKRRGFVLSPARRRARVTDRPGWVTANVASFQRLLRPLTQKLEAAMSKPAPMLGPVAMRVPAQVSRNISGVQLGLLLGWMSTRVLGQYDQLLIEDERPRRPGHRLLRGPQRHRAGRPVRFPTSPVPAVDRTARSNPPSAVHRRALVAATFPRPCALPAGRGRPGPEALIEALKTGGRARRRDGKNPLDEGGLMALLASPEQRQALDRIGGFMSLLEGHGDVVMNRAAQGRIPQAQRFARVLQQRRQRSGAAKVVSSLVGLDAKLKQYEKGERFIDAVEKAGGRELFDRVWQARVVTQHGGDPRTFPMGRASRRARPYRVNP